MILVDFRGFDTLGEISVVVIAGVAAVAALTRRTKARAMNSLILSTATPLLAPVILLLSVLVFLRGHNAPGGGFIGGLLAATAFALIEKAEGLAAARRALRFRPQSIAATGLGCALVSGLWGGLGDGHFLKGVWPAVVDATGLPLARSRSSTSGSTSWCSAASAPSSSRSRNGGGRGGPGD